MECVRRSVRLAHCPPEGRIASRLVSSNRRRSTTGYTDGERCADPTFRVSSQFVPTRSNHGIYRYGVSVRRSGSPCSLPPRRKDRVSSLRVSSQFVPTRSNHGIYRYGVSVRRSGSPCSLPPRRKDRVSTLRVVVLRPRRGRRTMGYTAME